MDVEYRQTLLPLAVRAKTSRWLDAVKDWLESGAASFLKLYGSLKRSAPAGSFSKMSPVYYPVGALRNPRRAVMKWEWDEQENCGRWTRSQTLALSSPSFRGSGISTPSGCLMLNTSEWPRDASVCSLSDVLETRADARYFLSRKACAGILRRAEKRGRELPRALREALEAVARTTTGRREDSMCPKSSEP